MIEIQLVKVTNVHVDQYKYSVFSNGKTTRRISSYSKLLFNGYEFEKNFDMAKFCTFYSFPAVYYLPYFDKLFKKIAFKIKFDRIRICF